MPEYKQPKNVPLPKSYDGDGSMTADDRLNMARKPPEGGKMNPYGKRTMRGTGAAIRGKQFGKDG